ncbi:MAG: hypothetical protein B6I20_10130 [Bacteroidetes bacterium 4572_117]|nr:MAG: hypothetical protein B6I20_10130 [Bacteroidetes bacterium 4572_117]
MQNGYLMALNLKYGILILLLLVSFLGKSQSPETDSLFTVIKKSGKDTNSVNSLLELASIYQRIDLDSAIGFSDDALVLSNEIEFHKGAANAFRQIGIIHYIKGNFEKALDNFSLSLKLWKKEGAQKGIGRAHMNIGIIYRNQGEYEKALESYLTSSKIQNEIKDYDGLARSYNNLVNIHSEQGNFDMALEYSFKSLKIHEDLSNDEEIATTFMNIGNIYAIQEDIEKELEYYKKAFEIYRKIEDEKGMADIYINIGESYNKEGRRLYNDSSTNEKVSGFYTKAIDNFQKALKLYQNIEYKKGIALSNVNLGVANFQLGNFEPALQYYEKSLIANEEMGDKIGIVKALKYLGEFYLHQGTFSKSITYLIKGNEIANELNVPELIMEVSEILSQAYAKTGQYKKAFNAHLQFKAMTDKIRNEENIRGAAQHEFRYKLDKKQKEMELEQIRAAEKLERQSLITKSAFLGLALMIAMVFFIFRSYKIKKKSNIQLADKNKQIIETNDELKHKNEEIKAIGEEMEQQRDIAVNARKEVVDSIQYAKRIQRAVLPAREMFVKIIPDYFIYFKPRDIVSGDFYWMKQIDNQIIIVAADCTGHGVPGAFMSLLGVAFLNEIVNKSMLDSGKILDKLREYIIDALHQTWDDTEAKDGMDLSLIVVDIDTKELQYSGAYNPLYHFRDGKLNEIKADKMPISLHVKKSEPFKKHTIELKEDDVIYLFSDGYADQFGGELGRKFKYHRFKDLLQSAYNKPMHIQKQILDEAYENWRGLNNQLDDILVIGLRF